MMNAPFLDLVQSRVVLLDGGMGTELMKDGLPQGACPESWNIERPDAIQRVHEKYYAAGSDAVLTNSFGGSVLKLSSFGLQDKCYDLNYAAARLAVEARPAGKFVGGSMGPTGKFLQPTGESSEQDFRDSFTVQAEALAAGGVDFFLIETMYDLREALCALQAARKLSNLPVFVTMTFNHSPRGFFTLMGNSVGACFTALGEQGVPLVGSNCTLDSAAMVDLVKAMVAMTSLPLVVQPNAGQPSLDESGRLSYSESADEFAAHMSEIIKAGARIVGGCCGTDPEFIRKTAEVLYLREKRIP